MKPQKNQTRHYLVRTKSDAYSLRGVTFGVAAKNADEACREAGKRLGHIIAGKDEFVRLYPHSEIVIA